MEHRSEHIDKKWLALLVVKMDPHVPPEEPYELKLEKNVPVSYTHLTLPTKA